MRFVVLGTGTNVGKTYFTRALTLALRNVEPALLVGAAKPVESGFGENSDAAQLASAGNVPAPNPHPLVALPDPVSPHLAARRVGVTISLDSIAAWVDDWERSAFENIVPPVVTRVDPSPCFCSVIESAGACFSPLSVGATNFDLALALEPATWILVAHDGLGVLHDLTVTLALMRTRGRQPDHVVLSASRPADASTGTNAAELRALNIADAAAELPANADALALKPFARRLLQSHR